MENNSESSLSEQELLTQIRDLQEKQVKIAKRTSTFICILTVAILISVIVLVPTAFMLMGKVSKTVDKASGAIDDVTGTIQRAETTLDGID